MGSRSLAMDYVSTGQDQPRRVAEPSLTAHKQAGYAEPLPHTDTY
jgi:hypothetical protein